MAFIPLPGRTARPHPLRRMAWRRALGASLVGVALAAAAPSWAQNNAPSAAVSASGWPAKAVTIMVPFPAGGGTDAFARPLSAQLTRQTGKQFIIDNKGGAGGTVGATLAAKAAPDGYTFFMGAVHHAIAPAMYPRLDYKLEDDFVPVALVSSVPQVIVVNTKNVPATDLKSLLDFIKKHPAKLNYGSAGNGTSHHLAGELFKLQTQTFITHIPYRGAGPALQDLMAGQVDLMFDGLGSSAAHIKSGRIKALAVAGPKRAPGFPEVPTTIDGGVPSYQVATWYGLWAPKGTPKEVVAALQAELKKAYASDEIKTAWTGLGSELPTLYGEAFGKFVHGELQRWAEVVKKSGAKLD